MTQQIHFLTRNPFKIATAELAMKPFDIEIVPLQLDISEIQADSNTEIARHSAIIAVQQTGNPVMREDHGFYLHAFPGWPGPYMAHTERTIPPDDLLRLVENKDRTGHFEMALSFATPEGEVIEYSFQLPTKITDSIRPGGKDFGWDSIISLGDDPRALSEYPQEDRYPLFTTNYVQLAQQLAK